MQDMIKRIVEADNQAKALEEENLKATEEEKQRIEEQAEIRQKAQGRRSETGVDPDQAEIRL